MLNKDLLLPLWLAGTFTLAYGPWWVGAPLIAWAVAVVMQ